MQMTIDQLIHALSAMPPEERKKTVYIMGYEGGLEDIPEKLTACWVDRGANKGMSFHGPHDYFHEKPHPSEGTHTEPGYYFSRGSNG